MGHNGQRVPSTYGLGSNFKISVVQLASQDKIAPQELVVPDLMYQDRYTTIAMVREQMEGMFPAYEASLKDLKFFCHRMHEHGAGFSSFVALGDADFLPDPKIYV